MLCVGVKCGVYGVETVETVGMECGVRDRVQVWGAGCESVRCGAWSEECGGVAFAVCNVCDVMWDMERRVCECMRWGRQTWGIGVVIEFLTDFIQNLGGK